MNFDENFADFGIDEETEDSMSKNAAAFMKSYARTNYVLTKASDLVGAGESEELVRDYLDFCYGSEGGDGNIKNAQNVIDVTLREEDFESITFKKLPNIRKESANTLILVEFFTHCCINCIHSIEDVREVHEEIENAFRDSIKNCKNGFKGIKVLSVHSPKFTREKDKESVKAFCKRNRMDHSEVINDPHCKLWKELGITCWPTLLILGPNPDDSGPNLLFTLLGEGNKDNLLLICKTAMKYFCSSPVRMMDQVDSKASEVTSTPTEVITNTFLRFPGKVAVLDGHLVVADSGNNRLIVLNSVNGVVEVVRKFKSCKIMSPYLFTYGLLN